MADLQRERERGRERDGARERAFTVRIQLVFVGYQSAVVLVIRNAVVVVIEVAGISFAVLVVVGLIGIGYVGTVVQVVLMSVLIYVLVIVARISNLIIICISLYQKDQFPCHIQCKPSTSKCVHGKFNITKHKEFKGQLKSPFSNFLCLSIHCLT